MKAEFTAEELEFQNEVKTFLNDAFPAEYREKVDANVRLSKDELVNWQKILFKKGWAAPSWPKEYGGTGWSQVQKYIFATEMGLIGAPEPIPFGMKMVAPIIMAYGTDEQKARFLPDILESNVWWCQGYSEPNSGSDLASLKTSAVRDGDHYIVNGAKTWNTYGQYADWIFCLVRTDTTAKKQEGISFLLIDMHSPGISLKPIVLIDGHPEVNEVFFDDVTVPEENIVAKRGEGWSVANSVLGHERGSLADPNATMNRLNTLINMMKEQTIDGRRLIDIPSYRDRLMQVQGKVMASQAHSLRLLSSKINPGQNVKLGGMIQKLVGTELRHELEGLAIDVLGEIGTLYEDSPYLKEDGSFQFTYMYFLGLIIGGGTNQIQKNIISERGLGMPKEPKVTEAS